MDRATALKQKLHAAKVCVEVNFNDDIPEFLEVELKDGSALLKRLELKFHVGQQDEKNAKYLGALKKLKKRNGYRNLLKQLIQLAKIHQK